MRLMLDLETLDTKPSAIIVSVGMVDIDNLDDTSYYVLDIERQRTRTISASTVKWWVQQSPQARDVFATTKPLPPPSAAVDIAKLVNMSDEIWGNGVGFDNAILANFLEQHGYEWPFWKDRCFRTVKALYRRELEGTDIIHGEAHNALDDAIKQAKQLKYIEERIGRPIS